AVDMGKVAHTAQEPSGDAWSAARAARDFIGAVGCDSDAQDTRTTIDDLLELFLGIEIEPHRDAETVAQWIGQQSRTRGRTDQCERSEIDLDGTGRRALADDEVELEILHRRIKDFLDRGTEPVNLIDEENVARLEIGEQRRKIARLCNHRA